MGRPDATAGLRGRQAAFLRWGRCGGSHGPGQLAQTPPVCDGGGRRAFRVDDFHVRVTCDKGPYDSPPQDDSTWRGGSESRFSCLRGFARILALIHGHEDLAAHENSAPGRVSGCSGVQGANREGRRSRTDQSRHALPMVSRGLGLQGALRSGRTTGGATPGMTRRRFAQFHGTACYRSDPAVDGWQAQTSQIGTWGAHDEVSAWTAPPSRAR